MSAIINLFWGRSVRLSQLVTCGVPINPSHTDMAAHGQIGGGFRMRFIRDLTGIRGKLLLGGRPLRGGLCHGYFGAVFGVGLAAMG